MSYRSPALLLIICYKAFTATLFALSALSIFLTLKNYEGLQEFSETLVLAGKRGVVAFLVEKVAGLSPKNLAFSGFASVIYSFVSALEAVGLWFQKAWAKWLVIGIVGISIPPEIYELVLGISSIKLFVFILNLGIFGYLIADFLKTRGSKERL
jgi:uncharacterized membrane protein (DUF2068 family)